MIVLPFIINDSEFSIFIGLQDGNIARMREYDPAEVPYGHVPAEVREGRRLRDVIIGFVTDEDIATVAEMVQNEAPVLHALRHLSRGFVFRPEDGGPALSFRKDEGMPQ